MSTISLVYFRRYRGRRETSLSALACGVISAAVGFGLAFLILPSAPGIGLREPTLDSESVLTLSVIFAVCGLLFIGPAYAILRAPFAILFAAASPSTLYCFIPGVFFTFVPPGAPNGALYLLVPILHTTLAAVVAELIHARLREEPQA